MQRAIRAPELVSLHVRATVVHALCTADQTAISLRRFYSYLRLFTAIYGFLRLLYGYLRLFTDILRLFTVILRLFAAFDDYFTVICGFSRIFRAQNVNSCPSGVKSLQGRLWFSLPKFCWCNNYFFQHLHLQCRKAPADWAPAAYSVFSQTHRFATGTAANQRYVHRIRPALRRVPRTPTDCTQCCHFDKKAQNKNIQHGLCVSHYFWCISKKSYKYSVFWA